MAQLDLIQNIRYRTIERILNFHHRGKTMSKSPHSLSEAISRLEDATKAGGSKNSSSNGIADDFENIKKALDDIKPHLSQLKEHLSQAAQDTVQETIRKTTDTLHKGKEKAKDIGGEVDRQVHENPWMAIGIVGLFALLIGFLLGRKD
jgi:ElaB/YqjD/DUF883 family membrane-anchored ribosome-binding protein